MARKDFTEDKATLFGASMATVGVVGKTALITPHIMEDMPNTTAFYGNALRNCVRLIPEPSNSTSLPIACSITSLRNG